ncbi:hypothetical protein D3C80_1738210 [compost metagenome]
MKNYTLKYDSLHFFECYLGLHSIDGNTISIPIVNLGIDKNTILNNSDELLYADRSYLIFHKVKKSFREVHEYQESLGNFKQEYILKDFESEYTSKSIQEFFVEGLFGKRGDWID